MKTKRARFAAVILAAATLYCVPAEGGYMNGKWGGTAPEIPYRICCGQFPGGACTPELISNIASAAETWNTHGGANVRLNYDGTTTSTACTNGNQYVEGVVILTTFYQINGAVGQADCNKPNITHCRVKLNTYYAWTTGWPSSNEWNYQQVVSHEFGHVLGLTDNNAGDVYTTMAQGNYLWERHIWADDINALKNGPAYSYGQRANQPIYHERSTDNALSWQYQSSNMNEYTNLSVGVVTSQKVVAKRLQIS
ncbi:MAG: matrixin family metalloprotease [Deltaproteobacteria bacterium]|nr:matrixin family metalloprotease [Deltaproteobacteria bacterium]